MPGEDRIWGQDGRDLGQKPAAQGLAKSGQPPPLVVGQAQAPFAELTLEDLVLGNEVLDHALPVTVDPA